jgi:hypothetical protein
MKPSPAVWLASCAGSDMLRAVFPHGIALAGAAPDDRAVICDPVA